MEHAQWLIHVGDFMLKETPVHKYFCDINSLCNSLQMNIDVLSTLFTVYTQAV